MTEPAASQDKSAQPANATPASASPANASPASASAVSTGALKRYRVMAVVTGVLLILVFLGMLRYIPGMPRTEEIDGALSILSQVHGFVYVVYVVTVYQVWSQARWGYGRLASMFFGGVVPLLSFFMEKRVTQEVKADQETSA